MEKKTVQSRWGQSEVTDPDWLNKTVKIDARKEGIIWDQISATVYTDPPQHVTYRFGPLDAILTYMLYGTAYEWYGIKLKAVKRTEA